MIDGGCLLIPPSQQSVRHNAVSSYHKAQPRRRSRCAEAPPIALLGQGGEDGGSPTMLHSWDMWDELHPFN